MLTNDQLIQIIDAATDGVCGVCESLGCSIGAAIFPENGKDDENLLKAADEAMYAAKKSGGQRFTIAQQKD